MEFITDNIEKVEASCRWCQQEQWIGFIVEFSKLELIMECSWKVLETTASEIV